jgi:hypothetical protein
MAAVGFAAASACQAARKGRVLTLRLHACETPQDILSTLLEIIQFVDAMPLNLAQRFKRRCAAHRRCPSFHAARLAARAYACS